ncbi:DUF4236 domain-containing protein [candidate division KSB1 bacterium]|nr:MAG: DUF4236 domain-containing protein [candidate division KSB1 bacterium]
MGWIFRRAIRFGPGRMNMSKRGVGWSWGVPGLRTGISADGRRYWSFGFPGTGLYYRKYYTNKLTHGKTTGSQQGQFSTQPQSASTSPTVTIPSAAKSHWWRQRRNP